MRYWARALIVAVLAVPAAFAWSSADAQSKKPRRYDANNQTAMSEAMAAVVEGSQKFVGDDVEGGIAMFRKAVKLQPRNALAQYALGEALLSQGKTQEAEGPLAAADDAASQGSPYKARIVFVLATTKERLKKWEEAKELWKRYLDLAQQRADGGAYLTSAAERLRLVDEWIKNDAAYVTVRARIAGGTSAPASSAPAAADAGPSK